MENDMQYWIGRVQGKPVVWAHNGTQGYWVDRRDAGLAYFVDYEMDTVREYARCSANVARIFLDFPEDTSIKQMIERCGIAVNIGEKD